MSLFSKAEWKFLLSLADGKTPKISKRYAHVLIHRLKKKIDLTETELDLYNIAVKNCEYWFNVIMPLDFIEIKKPYIIS